MSGRTFTADYDKSNIATRVWIPLGLAAVTGMTGLLAGVPGLSIIAAILTFVALRFWPLTRFDRPALKLSEDGVEIDGLGAVRWRDISDVRDGMVQVKAVKLPAIDLSFTRPIPDVFSATAATRLRPWEIRIFKLRRDGKIRLDLSKLEDTPEDVRSAFRYFMSGNA